MSVAVERAGRLAARVPIWGWLLALVALSAAVRVLLSSNAPAPWIFVDELIYSELGKSAADGGPLAIRGVANNGYGYVYPYLLAPAYALFDAIPDAYDAIRVTNAVLMSLAAVPTYLLARRLASRPLALLAAALAVSIPAMVYTSVVMTENAFYPLFLLAALALVRAIERPTLLRQALVLVAIVACFYTRSQAVALFPALVTAYALWAVLETRAADEPLLSRHLVRRLWRFAGTWLVLGAGVVLVLAVQLGRGQPLSGLLGAYAVTTSSERYSVSGVVRWFLWHVAELDLWLGLLPFLAFVVLCAVSLTRGASPRTRVYVAVALPLAFWLTLVVAAFALYTGNERIEERNLFYVGALFLVALVWWLGAGLPRPRIGFGVGLLLAVALPGVLPFASFINVSAVSDTFGLLPLWAIQDHLGSAAYLPAVVLVVCIAAGVLALVLPARWWLLLPALVLAYFAIAQSPVETKTDASSQGSLFEGIRTAPDWIDRAVPDGAEVAVVWSGAPSHLAVFENEFFNRSVGPIYRLPTGPALPGSLPESVLTPDVATGALVDAAGQPVQAQYALVDASTSVLGEVVAADAARGMQVVRVDGPLGLATLVTGIQPDSWTGPSASWTRYGCKGGTLTALLQSDQGLHAGEPVTVVATTSAGETAQAVVQPTDAGLALVVPLAPVDGRCDVGFAVSPTAVPAQRIGGGDTRELGIKVTGLTYEPPAP